MVLFAAFFLFNFAAYAGDQVDSAEAATSKFKAACEKELKETLPAETMKQIDYWRQSSAGVSVQSEEPGKIDEVKNADKAETSKRELYGSLSAVGKASGKVWVLSYLSMKAITVYIDAGSGKVLCIVRQREG
jgi:hypothetical protein